MKPTAFRNGFRPVVAAIVVAGLLALPRSGLAGNGRNGGSGGSGQTQGATFSGQATVVRATVLGSTLVLSDTGPLPSGGGALENSLLETSTELPVGVGSVQVRVLHAATVGQGDRSRSEASVADLSLTVGGTTVAASFLMARALAQCSGKGSSVSGESEIVGLVIDGQSIAVSGAPNETIALPLGIGSVIINEQSGSAKGGTGQITVNALHVIVSGVADVIVSSAHADVVCSGSNNCQGSKDFVTGGGWITSPSGSRGTFAVAGGIRKGAFWGHLEYNDHNGLKVKGTGVTAYTIVNTTTRTIRGTCDINGSPGTYEATVSDNGEPGRQDTFLLDLSTGYSASDNLEGGNIQLHVLCKD